MNIIDVNVDELKPYEQNPRNNKEAVKYVANSIKEFGFRVPLVIDTDFVIVCGHTRYEAAKQLEMETVPCLIADDLTDEQIKAFRLADNKTAEVAEWDFSLLETEMSEIFDIDMSDFGFNMQDDIDWADVEDLDEETYEEPVKDMLECPHCHHIDSKNHFKKVEAEVKRKEVDDFSIRKANLDDIDKIKEIADNNTHEIGFVLKPALEEHCKKESLIVAVQGDKVLGFCNYNKRKKDGVNVIYEVCTDKKYRGNGIGRALLNSIERPIVLKCPVDNESNEFYKHYGFNLIDVEEGKNRKLNVWELK